MSNEKIVNPITYPNNDTFIAELPKENLKSLFYLFAGSPDTNIKLFNEIICLTQDNIIELNDRVNEKLANHDIDNIIVSVDVTYNEDEITHFGIWQEFIDNNWKTHKRIESLTIKWDFLVKLPRFVIPQRHTILVKFSSDLTPLHILKAMFSDDPNTLENAIIEEAPIVCRIDFINHILSEELMQIIEKWHKSIQKADDTKKYIKFLKEKKSAFAIFIHTSFPVFSFIFCLSLLNIFTSIFNKDTIITIEIMKFFILWLNSSLVIIFLSYQIGHKFAVMAFKKISSYKPYPIFNFTNGDKKLRDEIIIENKNSITKFIISAIGSILLDIISFIITYNIFKSW